MDLDLCEAELQDRFEVEKSGASTASEWAGGNHPDAVRPVPDSQN